MKPKNKKKGIKKKKREDPGYGTREGSLGVLGSSLALSMGNVIKVQSPLRRISFVKKTHVVGSLVM